MPLGVNDITLAEISTAYQTLLTGKVFKCLDGDWTDPCFIKEIKNRDGKVIFKNKTESKVVLGDTITSQMAVMLHSVFVNGTARSQYTHITVTSPDKAITLRYPALGKTGTTNDYRNVAFLGALPTYVNEKNGISTDSVIAIGSYVGFDDNKPLKSGRTRIAGASGGLPQWADFAKKEINILGLPEKIDFLDISMLAAGEVPLVLPNERGQLTVDPMTGSIIAGGSAEQGRPLPWIEVPGFTPPQVHAAAAETAAENGIMVSLPMPAAAPAAPADSANVAGAAPSAPAEGTTSEGAAVAVPAQPAQPAQPKVAAMPKDDDWDLPEGFDSKSAFVPIEAE
jgi:membrane peptidoglycan carboxypeptidase